jgi:hypothetical protein
MRVRPARREIRAFLTCGGVLLVVLFLAAPAVGAHPDKVGALAPAPATPPADLSPGGSWAWLAVAGSVGLGVVGWAGRPRRLAAVVALALAVFACETALHSAHHLDDPQQAEQCAVYAASLHVPGAGAGPAPTDPPPPPPTRQGSVARTVRLDLLAPDGPQSRAPPVRVA